MRARVRQSGYALAAISLLGMAAMGSAALFITESGVGEAAAVEDDLIRMRANWAMNGHLNYVLSRARQDGACFTACADSDTSRAGTLDDYGREVYNAVPAKEVNKNGSQRRWLYDEINGEYAVDTNLAGADIGTLLDGRIIVSVGFQPSNIRLDSIDEALNRIPEHQATLCAGLANPGDNCPLAVTNDNTSGIVRIVDFRVVR